MAGLLEPVSALMEPWSCRWVLGTPRDPQTWRIASRAALAGPSESSWRDWTVRRRTRALLPAGVPLIARQRACKLLGQLDGYPAVSSPRDANSRRLAMPRVLELEVHVQGFDSQVCADRGGALPHRCRRRRECRLLCRCSCPANNAPLTNAGTVRRGVRRLRLPARVPQGSQRRPRHALVHGVACRWPAGMLLSMGWLGSRPGPPPIHSHSTRHAPLAADAQVGEWQGNARTVSFTTPVDAPGGPPCAAAVAAAVLPACRRLLDVLPEQAGLLSYARSCFKCSKPIVHPQPSSSAWWART